jgi:hypothetical protein
MTATYQPRGGRLATVPALAHRLLRDAARIIRAGHPGLSTEESQNLSDVADGRGSTMLFRALDAASACRSEADALALVEALRRYVLARRRRHGLVAGIPLEVLREEMASNAAANAAEFEYVNSPSPATRDRLIETHVRQMTASRQLIDSLAVQ